MKQFQPQFESIVHRLRSLLPITAPKIKRNIPEVAKPPVRWQQLEFELRSR